MKALSHLERIRLDWRAFSDDAIADLRRALPTVEITRDSAFPVPEAP